MQTILARALGALTLAFVMVAGLNSAPAQATAMRIEFTGEVGVDSSGTNPLYVANGGQFSAGDIVSGSILFAPAYAGVTVDGDNLVVATNSTFNFTLSIASTVPYSVTSTTGGVTLACDIAACTTTTPTLPFDFLLFRAGTPVGADVNGLSLFTTGFLFFGPDMLNPVGVALPDASEAETAFGGAVFSNPFLSFDGGATALNFASVTATAELVPEPGSIALLGAGFLGLAGLRRRRRKAA